MLAENKCQTGFPLQSLLEGLTDAPVRSDILVHGISSDSRDVREGDLFIACRGQNTRGSLYIRDALNAGAVAVVMDEGLLSDLDRRRTAIFPVPDLTEKLGLIAGRFYGDPTKHLHLAGVTGTNGKTSICWWLAKVHSMLTGRQAGLIGTLGYGCYPRLESGPNTTPGAVSLQRLLAGFVEADVDTAFMEVSSHALDQGRVNGIDFDVAVFTNLSQDHLDYHRNLQDYFRAKEKLFLFKSLRAVVANCDDAYGRALLRGLPAGMEAISYGLSGAAQQSTPPLVKATLLPGAELVLDIASPWGNGRVRPGITGKFNAGNILAVVSVLGLAGFPLDRILEKLDNIGPVPGRMESFRRADGARIVVDYAHTPAALEQALAGLKESCKGRLICVFGCGGERDREKRPRMGELAQELADEVILTDDNPRHESGDEIVEDILSGMTGRDSARLERNRSRAIELALGQAGPDDVVLIAGKGHETFQEVAGKRYPFNDRQQVRCLLGKEG